MIERKLSQIFGDKPYKNRVYLINDGIKAIYVGMARRQCVQDRINRHINDYFTKVRPSGLSIYLYTNHPTYNNWKINIYTIKDINRITKSNISCAACAEKKLFKWLVIKDMRPIQNKNTPGAKCTCNT